MATTVNFSASWFRPHRLASRPRPPRVRKKVRGNVRAAATSMPATSRGARDVCGVFFLRRCHFISAKTSKSSNASVAEAWEWCTEPSTPRYSGTWR